MTAINIGYTATPANADLETLPQLVPAGRSATAPEYVRNNAVFNPLDYDAAGDGSNDDTAAVAAALAAAAVSGGTVRIQGGYRFKVTATLPVGSNVTVEGGGEILASGMSGQVVFSATGKENITLRGFTISGLHAAGVTFTACTFITVRDMDISGGTSVISGWGAGIRCRECEDVVIEDNYLHGNGSGSDTDLCGDILINGSDPYGYKRHYIRGNTCTSTAVHANIQCYNLQDSEISGNECSGAYTKAAQNSGYGILLYSAGYSTWDAGTAYVPGDIATIGIGGGAGDYYLCILANTNQMPPNATYWTLLDANVRDNRIVDNRVHDTQGTAIYTANAKRTIVSGNQTTDTSTVQTETSLPSAGIAINGGSAIVVNNQVRNSGRSGITIANTQEGTVVSSNTIKNTAGLGGIRITGNVVGARIDTNEITECAGTAIGGFDPTWTFDSLTITNNRAVAPAAGIQLMHPVNCTVGKNTITMAGGHGIWMYSTGSNNSVSANTVLDSGQLTPLTYANIFVQTAQTAVVGNVTGNTAANGARYGVLIDTTAVLGSSVVGNVGKDNRTSDFNIAAGCASGGNVDTANVGAFSLGGGAELSGPGVVGLQLKLGTAVGGAVGRQYSSGDTFLAGNAQQIDATGNWHQVTATNDSWLIKLVCPVAGGVKIYKAAAGKVDGDTATFWGTPVIEFGGAGYNGMKVSGTQVVATQGAAVANIATADATDLASAIALANATKATLNTLLGRLRAGSGHGLIA